MNVSSGRKTTSEILALLPEVFGAREVEKFVRHPAQWLSRAAASGRIERIQRGTYWNRTRYPDLSLPFIACRIKSAPSYISCEWVLHARGVLLQRPFTCSVVTLSTAVGRGRKISWRGETIEFSHMDAKLFRGYEEMDGVFLATAEKAYLDTLYYHREPEQWGELELDALDMDHLRSMAQKFPRRVLQRVLRL